MDIITAATTTTPKSPEPESETPTRIQQPTTKPLSFSNGVLKRHHPPSHHPYHQHNHLANPAAVAVVIYKECQKNHAASLGGHALDGCGEFMPAPSATAGDPTSIKCAACGCHRNFHRRDNDEPPSPLSPVIEYQPHHRHHPPPPPPPPPFHPLNNHHHHHHRSPSSASPPPISSSYYPSAPHMLLALSSGGGLSVPPENTAAPASTNHPLATSRKRFRTKFTPEQKEKMLHFAERVGWKMQKRDEDLVQEFCHEVGVDRGVLKVWMHNNKNTFGKRDNNDLAATPPGADANNANANVNAVTARNVLEQIPINNNDNINGNGLNGEINGGEGSGNDDGVGNRDDDDSGANGGGTNGSSSSS